MLLTVPRTSTNRRSRNRMARSPSRSIARSTAGEALRAPASVFGVGDTAVIQDQVRVAFLPGRSGPGMVAGSPRLVFHRIFHRVLLFVRWETAARASDSRLDVGRTNRTKCRGRGR